MRLQSSHKKEDRGLDAYFTPPEAIYSIMALEKAFIPSHLWEPAAGNGAIVKPLREAGYFVAASDIAVYGLENCCWLDYLTAPKPLNIQGIITNPPYNLALTFLQKALTEVDYVAFLLRTNFLESTTRLPFFKATPPARVWVSSRRLPMMHRQGWEGKEAPSNTCFAWFIWDKNPSKQTTLNWFDWALEAPKGGLKETSILDTLDLKD